MYKYLIKNSVRMNAKFYPLLSGYFQGEQI